MDQLVEWLGEDFDGVIAFDESHNMANNMPTQGKRGTKGPSKMALAAMDLQKRLPMARVVYFSATAATEIDNYGYATRLGLWGRGTPFPTKENFMEQIGSGGVAAMELLSQSMKSMGLYTSRSLTYNDGTPAGTVEYDRIEHQLTNDQSLVYDKLAEGWQTVLANIDGALKITGGAHSGRAKAQARGQFWGAHQRFFNQIITAMQTPTVINNVEEDLKNGRSVVIQLTNTHEAQQERSIAAMTEKDSLEDFDLTPRDTLLNYVEKSFPTAQYAKSIDQNGNPVWNMVVDSHGDPVQNEDAVAIREQLLQDLASVRVPESPLDMIVNHFGWKKVAEITGRKRRVVIAEKEDGTTGKIIQKRGARENKAEMNSFMDGGKRILIFSEAGGTGASYHSDIRVKNQQRRIHYLLQPGWRATKALQGLGRTHRTNQKFAPKYVLVTTNLKGQKRFISSIARRLDQLGALTRGQRQATSSGIFSAADNLESTEAKDAFYQFIRDMVSGEIESVSVHDFQSQTGLKIVDEHGQALHQLPPITQFLNRLLSLNVDMQNAVFSAYEERLLAKVEMAIADGTLDQGVRIYKAHSIVKTSEETVYTDSKTGAKTKHIQLKVKTKNSPYLYEKIPDKKFDGFIRNKISGNIFAVFEGPDKTNSLTGSVTRRLKLIAPSGHVQYIDNDHTALDKYEVISKKKDEQTKQLWDAVIAELPEFHEKDEHIITGAILAVWDRISGKPNIYRLNTDNKEQMIGWVIHPVAVKSTLKSLGASVKKQKYTTQEYIDQVLKKRANLVLSNGWHIDLSVVSYEKRIELHGPSFQHNEELKKDGVILERIGYSTRYFIPVGENGVRVFENVTKSRPVVDVEVEVNDPGVIFSTRTTEAGGQTVEAVQRNVKSIQEEFGLLHPIVVVQSVSNLPEEGTVRERAVKESKTGMVIEGIYNTKDGKIYLVADSIRNRADALRVVLHETVGHLGLRKALGDKFNAILDTIYSNKEYAKAIDALATELKKTTRIATEEWFARKVQVGEVENSLWTKVIAKLRQVLRDLGFTIKFSDAELKSLIERSYTEARRGEEGAGTAKDVERFSTRKREEGAEDEGQTLEGFEKMMDEVEAEELMREAGKMMDQQIEEAENIRFATRAATQPTQPNPPTAQSLLSLDPETFRQKMARYFQNKLNRLEQAESKIKEVRGVQQLPLEQETSLWGGLWIGSASDEILEFDKQVVEGKDSLFKRMLDDNISLKEMGTYLWVRHAEERNDTIEIREGKENGAGIKTNVANRLKRWMDQRGKPYAQYAAEIDGLVRETLDRRYDAGLLTEKEYTALTTEWKNYVPLKSFYEDRPAMKTGKGFAITRKEFKKARGRFNPPENPLVQLIIDHHEAVIRAEKNKVDNAFLKMIQENPSNAWSWERQKYVPVYDKSGEIDYLKPITSKDEYIMKVDQETSDWFKNNYKRDIPRGSVIKITIKDKALREGMQNLMDNKVQGPKVLLAVNNFLRAVNTFINPEFVLTNFERDLQTALVHVWGENSGKMAIQVLKDVPGAIRGVWKEVREGTPNYHSQMYDRMKRLGGRVGFFDYKSLPELEADLEKKLDRYSKQGLTFGKGWDATLKFITDMNEAVESGVRLAFFEKLVESGVEEHRAALMAKELTVNFNKKGEFGTIMNTLWLFSNATTQGGARIFKAMKNPRVRKIVGTMTMFSFFNTILNRMLDPDDWDRYDQWTKDNYLLFPIPGMDKRVGIRLPYVYNVFHVAAQVAADIGMGKATVVDGMGRMVAAINDAVNPFSGRSWTMFMPTFSQPIFQVLDNKNFAGASIYKSQPEFGPKKPNFMQHFKTVNPATKVLTEWLNDISGGDTKLETSGFIDFNPEVMDHILEQIGGGAGRVIANTLNTVETTVLTKDFPPVKKIPFARQIIKGPSEWVDRSRAYDILDESRRRVMGTTKTDQFFESVKRALDNKEIEPDEAKRLRTEFRNNQRAAKGLPKLQQGRPGPPSPPRPPRPPSYRNQ